MQEALCCLDRPLCSCGKSLRSRKKVFMEHDDPVQHQFINFYSLLFQVIWASTDVGIKASYGSPFRGVNISVWIGEVSSIIAGVTFIILEVSFREV